MLEYTGMKVAEIHGNPPAGAGRLSQCGCMSDRGFAQRPLAALGLTSARSFEIPMRRNATNDWPMISWP